MSRIRALVMLLIVSAVLFATLGTWSVRTSIPKSIDESALFASKTRPDKQSHYLLAYTERRKSGWMSSLIDVASGGKITYLKTTAPNERRRRVATYSDFREMSGKKFFFASFPPFEGDHIAPYRVACELLASGQEANCYEHEYLDIHVFFVTRSGDTIYMFYEPRVAWHGGIFELRPLDLVLRQIAADGTVVWEWNSANHLLPDDVVLARGNAFTRAKVDIHRYGFGPWLSQKISILAERWAIRGLLALGLLDRPLCIRLSQDCVVNKFYDDYVHANSLEWDNGGILISANTQNAVIKIRYPQGDIVWRLGGYDAKRSDFVLENDPLNGFSRQHSVRKLPNGNILLFDNGVEHPNPRARAAEYRLDFKRMTATLVWEYRAEPEYGYRNCCGAVQRLSDGNTLITWGGWETELQPKRGSLPIATEVNEAKQVVFEIRSRNFEGVYRVWAVP